MPTTDVDLTPVRRGDPRTTIVVVKNDEGATVDLSVGGTWTCQFRAQREHDTIIAAPTVDDSLADEGILSFVLTGPMTRQLGTGHNYGELEGSTFGTLPTLKIQPTRDVTRIVVGEDIVEPTGGLVETVTVTYNGTVSTAAETAIALVQTTAENLAPAIFDFFDDLTIVDTNDADLILEDTQ